MTIDPRLRRAPESCQLGRGKRLRRHCAQQCAQLELGSGAVKQGREQLQGLGLGQIVFVAGLASESPDGLRDKHVRFGSNGRAMARSQAQNRGSAEVKRDISARNPRRALIWCANRS